MPFRFTVTVPFAPFVHESLDSRIQSALPEADLSCGIAIRPEGDEYLATLMVVADGPAAAKAAAVRTVESLLKVIAASNDSFTVRIAGVVAVRIEQPDGATVEETATGYAVQATETMFFEEYVDLRKTKGSLAAEEVALMGLDGFPEYVRNCLDLNYLMVSSDRRPVRWLLAATGLEALAVGRLGAQPTLSGLIKKADKTTLRSAIERAVDQAGVNDADLQERAVQRVLGATLTPVAVHVRQYLALVGDNETSADDIRRWWGTRGSIAHGAGAEIDLSELRRLMNCFQRALRVEVGVEP